MTFWRAFCEALNHIFVIFIMEPKSLFKMKLNSYLEQEAKARAVKFKNILQFFSKMPESVSLMFSQEKSKFHIIKLYKLSKKRVLVTRQRQ